MRILQFKESSDKFIRYGTWYLDENSDENDEILKRSAKKE